jgi:hypothetical protein
MAFFFFRKEKREKRKEKREKRKETALQAKRTETYIRTF